MPSLTKIQSGFLDDSTQFTLSSTQKIEVSDTTSYDPANAPVYPTSSDLLTLVNPTKLQRNKVQIPINTSKNNVREQTIRNFFTD